VPGWAVYLLWPLADDCHLVVSVMWLGDGAAALWHGLCRLPDCLPSGWAGQQCPAFLLVLLLSSLAVHRHGGGQGQLAPTQTLAQGKGNGDRREPALEPFSWPGAVDGCVLPSRSNMGKVVVLFPQFLLFRLFRF